MKHTRLLRLNAGSGARYILAEIMYIYHYASEIDERKVL